MLICNKPLALNCKSNVKYYIHMTYLATSLLNLLRGCHHLHQLPLLVIIVTQTHYISI